MNQFSITPQNWRPSRRPRNQLSPPHVTGPVHTVTNTWEPNRDVLASKQNKAGSSVISQYNYAVNAIGQRTAVTTSGSAFPAAPSWAWGYDLLGQVITADSSVNTSDRSYQYDTIGNRQKSANSLTLPTANNYTANTLNQYSQLTSNSITSNPVYDLDGNMTSGPLPAAPTANSTLTWDAENRLISTTVGTVTTTYQYDAQSRRIAKSTGTNKNVFLYNGWNSVADYSLSSNQSTLQKTRLWGADLSGSMKGAGGVGGLLLITDHSALIISHSPTYDGNGNISDYLTTTGNIAAHYEYDPFGNTVVNTDTSNQFTYKFSTKPADPETGLYYYGYRYYDPMTGRWPSRDPIEEEGGVNLYGFVRNSVLVLIDRLGLYIDSKGGDQAGPPSPGKIIWVCEALWDYFVDMKSGIRYIMIQKGTATNNSKDEATALAVEEARVNAEFGRDILFDSLFNAFTGSLTENGIHLYSSDEPIGRNIGPGAHHINCTCH
jgi:RHS repeat-associated protein